MDNALPGGEAAGGLPYRGDEVAPVFVLAPARSYSTVFIALLAGHPMLYGFPELLIFSADTVAELLDERRRKPELPEDWCRRRLTGPLRALAEVHEGTQEPAAIERAHRWLERHGDWPTTRLLDHLLALVRPRAGVEKSPETVTRRGALRRCFEHYPTARFIHLTRHPVDSIESMRRHWGELPWNGDEEDLVRRCAAGWYRWHSSIMAELSGLPAERWIRVRAEDAIGDPLNSMPAVLDHLRLPSGPEVIAGMADTERWRFSGVGSYATLYGGDWKFLFSPKLRPVPSPGPVALEHLRLPAAMRQEIGRLAGRLGY